MSGELGVGLTNWGQLGCWVGVGDEAGRTVLVRFHLGPPNWTKSRTFVLRFRLAL